MSKIRVYVRVRPPLPGEFDAPGCLNCTELEDAVGNWIQIKKDGEPRRYFSRVWGPESAQDDVFRTVGISTVSDVFEGYYGCIFVYGQTGTGKTFTLGCTTPSLEGVQPRCIQFMFQKAAKEAAKYETVIKQQYVQLYRDSIQDLLEPSHDNMSLTVDEVSGATIIGCTTREVHSYEESLTLIKEGDDNRVVANTKMNSASSRSHACLITEVYRTNRATGSKSMGRLYLIDLAGSERVSKSGVTGDAYKEAVSINKSLTVLGSCIAGLVNNEKVVAFREAKLTRLLQHSLAGNGRTSVIVTIRPDSPNMQESLCTLKFGERAQKVETQMTPAAYREQVAELTEKLLVMERGTAEGRATSTANQAWLERLKLTADRKRDELRKSEEVVEERIGSLRQAHAELLSQMREEYNEHCTAIDSESADEVQRLRFENAAVLEDIETKVAAVEIKTTERLRHAEESLKVQYSAALADRDEAEHAVVQLSPDDDEDSVNRAQHRLLGVEERVGAIRSQLRLRTPNTHMGLSAADLEARAAAVQQTLTFLVVRKAELLEKTSGWDTTIIRSRFQPSSREAVAKWVEKSKQAVEDISSATASEISSAPSSTPPSTSPPDSDSDSDVSTGSIESSDRPFPRKAFDSALASDKMLLSLVDQIVEYLNYGTTVFVLSSSTSGPVLHKRHMFIDTKASQLLISEYVGGTGGDLERSEGRLVTEMSQITRVSLGQTSPVFRSTLEDAPIVAHGTAMPENSSMVSTRSLSVFAYRSMTIFSGEKPILDVVVNTDSDFESWAVTFHRATGVEPQWGAPLDISTYPLRDRLSDTEAKVCGDLHILPACFLATKQSIYDRPHLFMTLKEFRTISTLDLLHAQRLFDYFTSVGVFEQVVVFHCHYLSLKAERVAKREQQERRAELRLQMCCMVLKHAPNDLGHMRQRLKDSSGKEREALLEMVQRWGPPPTRVELDAWGGEDGVMSLVKKAELNMKEELGTPDQVIEARKISDAAINSAAQQSTNLNLAFPDNTVACPLGENDGGRTNSDSVQGCSVDKIEEGRSCDVIEESKADERNGDPATADGMDTVDA